MAASCIGRFSGRVIELNVPPMLPAAISLRIISRGISGPMLIRRSWPIFSSRVICFIRLLTKASLFSRGAGVVAANTL
ncbi:hypothetical protein D3C85_566800 [compost metagenome]